LDHALPGKILSIPQRIANMVDKFTIIIRNYEMPFQSIYRGLKEIINIRRFWKLLAGFGGEDYSKGECEYGCLVPFT
jgi:hypothetical protein